ncbi:MAG TPA: hypothetical protein VK849_00190 [Longimicrobiales bacterium]|nr:hypothetical protein [Longimicrobiales bacterium]
MTRSSLASLALLGSGLLSACEPPPSTRPPGQGAETAASVPAEDTAEAAPAPKTMVLKAIMTALAADMGTVAAGFWVEDLETVSRAAGAIADHPRVPPEQMAAIQRELGARFTEFVAFDRSVHDLAVELRDGAAAMRPAGELAPLFSEITAACLACHTSFRARLVPILAPAATP